MTANQLIANLDVSRETEARLRHFADLVLKWTPKINLLSRREVGMVWHRHILDSLQLQSLVPLNAAHWVDLGSGGGFPGIVNAIASHDRGSMTKFTLVESDQRKVAFLRTVVRDLDLSVEVLPARAEDIPMLNADVLSARALAPLAQLLHHATKHLASSGRCLFPKGRSFADEISAARLAWNFDVTCVPSLTETGAAVLVVQNVSHV